MPTYKVTDPQTGKTVRLTGDSPPTEQELTEVFKSLGSPEPAPKRRSWGETAADIGRSMIRPTLEGAGMIGGGVVGGMGAGPIGAAGLGGAGYALGKKAADYILDEGGRNTVAKDVTQSLKDVGTGAAMDMTGQIAGKLVSPSAVSKAARRLYRSTLKPPPSEGLKETTEAVDTLVRERIAPTQKGFAKWNDLVRDLDRQATDLIKLSKTTDVSPEVMTQEVAKLKESAANLPRREEVWKQIDSFNALLNKFGKETNPVTPLSASQRRLSVERLNGIKKSIYREFKRFYGAEAPPLEAEMHKAAARGARKEIEKQVPAITPLNQRLSELMNAGGMLERATGRLENYEPIGLTDWAAMAAGHGSPALGAASRIGRLAGPRSGVSFLLDALANKMPSVPTSTLLGKLLMLQGKELLNPE